MVEAIKTQELPALFQNFTSIIGISRSERSLLAVARHNQSAKDYLIHYFRVQPNLFQNTVLHLQNCMKITHPNVQRIIDIFTDNNTSDICILYDTVYTLLERVKYHRVLSDKKLLTLLNQILLGLLAQKEFLGTENNFLDEWNIFQCNGNFTIGASLPEQVAKLLVPLEESIDQIACQLSSSVSIKCPIQVNDDSVDVHDAYRLGALALEAIGQSQFFYDKLTVHNTNFQIQKEKYEYILEETLRQCANAGYSQQSISIIKQLLSCSQGFSLEKLKSTFENITKARVPVALIPFRTFTNGEILNPDQFPEGHYGILAPVQRSHAHF